MLHNQEEREDGGINIIGNIIFFLYLHIWKCNDAIECYAKYFCFVLVIAQEPTDGEGWGYFEILREEAHLTF